MSRPWTGRNISLELTAAERAVLLDTLTALPPDVQQAIRAASTSGLIMFSPDELRDVARCLVLAADGTNNQTTQATLDAVSKRIQHQVLSYMNKRLNRLSKARGASNQEPIDGATPSSENGKPLQLYQLKITLLHIKPPIWRRIQVEDCTLDMLHEHIQTVMGWTNSHLHRFEIGDQRYGDPELLKEDFHDFGFEDSTTTKISEIVPADAKRFAFKYEYDFGNSWEHQVLCEGCPPLDSKTQYPLCLEGERACPPEDCGGVGGYAEFIEAMSRQDS